MYFISLNSFCFTALKCYREWNPDCVGVSGKFHVDFLETRIHAEVLSNIHCMKMRVNLCLPQHNEVAGLLIGWRYMQANSCSLQADMNFFINIMNIISFFSNHPNKPFIVFYLLLFIFWRIRNKSLLWYIPWCKRFLGFQEQLLNVLTIASIHSIFQMDKIKRSYLILSYWIQQVLESNLILSHSSTCGRLPV